MSKHLNVFLCFFFFILSFLWGTVLVRSHFFQSLWSIRAIRFIKLHRCTNFISKFIRKFVFRFKYLCFKDNLHANRWICWKQCTSPSVTQLTASNSVSCCFICFLLIWTERPAELKPKQHKEREEKMQQMFSDHWLLFRFGSSMAVPSSNAYKYILHIFQNVLHFSLKCVASNYANNLLLSTPHICFYLFFCILFLYFYLELFIFTFDSFSSVIQFSPNHFVKPNVITCQ